MCATIMEFFGDIELSKGLVSLCSGSDPRGFFDNRSADACAKFSVYTLHTTTQLREAAISLCALCHTQPRVVVVHQLVRRRIGFSPSSMFRISGTLSQRIRLRARRKNARARRRNGATPSHSLTLLTASCLGFFKLLSQGHRRREEEARRRQEEPSPPKGRDRERDRDRHRGRDRDRDREWERDRERDRDRDRDREKDRDRGRTRGSRVQSAVVAVGADDVDMDGRRRERSRSRERERRRERREGGLLGGINLARKALKVS